MRTRIGQSVSYDGCTIGRRPRVQWPKGAKVALWVVPNVEHYEFMPPKRGPRDPWPRYPHPDILGYAQRDYGNRVAIWRLFELLDDLNIRCSVSLNLSVYERFPEIMKGCEDRHWDVICHGYYNTEYISSMSRAEEGDFIDSCIERFKILTGRRFRGWFSPNMSYTHNTIPLLASKDIDYFCDWPLDDQPVRIQTDTNSIVAMPYQYDVNDGLFFNRRYRFADAEAFAQTVIDYFDQVYHEGGEQGRVMCVGLHPYILGQPHNIPSLRKAFEYILGHSGVWNATGSEILDAWAGDDSAIAQEQEAR